MATAVYLRIENLWIYFGFLILMSCDVIVHGCMYRCNYMLTTKAEKLPSSA